MTQQPIPEQTDRILAANTERCALARISQATTLADLMEDNE